MRRTRLVPLAALVCAACTSDVGPDPARDEAPPGRAGLALTRKVPSQHATVQAAIDAAASGDVIEIAPGAYGEDLVIKPGLTLVGAGASATSIYGRVSAAGAAGVVLRDLTIRGDFDLDATGLDLQGASATVESVVIRGFLVGARLTAAAAPTRFDGVRVESCGEGVALDTASKLTLANSVVASTRGHGVRVGPGTGGAVLIVNSLFYGNGFATSGAAVRFESSASASFRLANSVLVSNKIGLSCSAACPADHDLVWGNGTNYSGSAVAAPSNLAVDPRLANLAEGDLTPRADSPLVDAGDPGVAPARDLLGQSRPAGGGVDIGPVERQVVVDATIILSEVMANPLDEGAGEFIELHNRGATAVDLAGWIVDDGDARDTLVAWLGGGTSLAPGGFAVVLDPDWTPATFAVPAGALRLTIAATATLGSGLAGNDPITLLRPDGTTVVDSYTHPFDPGNGVSVEKDDPSGGDVAGNWVASPCGSSPGADNCAWAPPPPPPVVTVVITEVMANPIDEATGEYVELHNTGASAVDVAGWILDDGDATDALAGWAGGATTIPAGGYAVVLDPDYATQYTIAPGAVRLTVASSVTLGNGLAGNDPITLRTATQALASSYGHPFDPGNGKAVVRAAPDAADLPQSWRPSACPTGGSPGAADCSDQAPPPAPTVVITEVMANPIDEDRDEYVELFNYGAAPIDLAGWLLSDGDTQEPLAAFDVGGPTILQPGGWALVLDSEHLATYPIPSGVLRLRTPDSSIGTGLATDDPITLRTPAGESVSTFGVPFNPGNGTSAERVALSGGDGADNWVASPCGASPGKRNCAAADELERALMRPAVVITEVMANPLDEAVGELVELYNAGAAPIDLAGYTLSDGSAAEALVRFSGGGAMTLAPGAFAVVLDRGYTTGYTIPQAALLLTVGDATLGNGLATSDVVTLYDAAGAPVSTYAHPFNPGNGVSAERAQPTAPDTSEAWVASTCGSGSSPGAPSCAGPAPAAGTRTFGEACAWGAAECQSGLCMIDALTGEARCTVACPPGTPCPADHGACASTGDVGAPFVCWDAGASEPPDPVGPPPARLLLTEVVVSPTTGEYVEIHNPGAEPVDLSRVWLADYAGYHAVTTGGAAPINSDFRARFPDGASIAAGAYLTVSLESATAFESEHGVLPDFDVAPSDARAPDLVGQLGGLSGLSNEAEAVVLFHWDGVSALVTDLDYVVWGAAGNGFDKTGVAVGAAAYAPDTALAAQRAASAPGGDGLGMSRCDLAETGETATGGNGIGGADETSEDLGATWRVRATTPGDPNDCGAACAPSCGACGDDGCGGSCGTCGGGQLCDAGACVTPTATLAVTAVAGFELPSGHGKIHELTLLRTTGQFTAKFGVAPPPEIGLASTAGASSGWALFFSAGERRIPGHRARVTQVVDGGASLFVATELASPGGDCTVLGLARPAWTLVRVARPTSGATALTESFTELERSCASGQPGGDECDDDRLCTTGWVCAGTTVYDNGWCNPNWMRRSFQVTQWFQIHDNGSLRSPIEVHGLATVPMDVIVYVELDHPAPDQLVITLNNAPGEDGTATGSAVVWDRRAAPAGINVIHEAVVMPGDEYVNGTWSLDVRDAVSGHAGRIVRWGLEITSRWD